ncbi:MAG: hypothetical protein LBG43_06235 [Treponema sp.]|nr:hypothetical protein [Treponema sp.]
MKKSGQQAFFIMIFIKHRRRSGKEREIKLPYAFIAKLIIITVLEPAARISLLISNCDIRKYKNITRTPAANTVKYTAKEK